MAVGWAHTFHPSRRFRNSGTGEGASQTPCGVGRPHVPQHTVRIGGDRATSQELRPQAPADRRERIAGAPWTPEKRHAPQARKRFTQPRLWKAPRRAKLTPTRAGKSECGRTGTSVGMRARAPAGRNDPVWAPGQAGARARAGAGTWTGARGRGDRRARTPGRNRLYARGPSSPTNLPAIPPAARRAAPPPNPACGNTTRLSRASTSASISTVAAGWVGAHR